MGEFDLIGGGVTRNLRSSFVHEINTVPMSILGDSTSVPTIRILCRVSPKLVAVFFYVAGWLTPGELVTTACASLLDVPTGDKYPDEDLRKDVRV